jgi:signal transduction histidine kinase
MAPKATRRIPQPLIFRLLFVFLGTGIFILSAVAGYLVFFSRAVEPAPHFLHRGLAKCTASLAAEIGNPPNFVHAHDLAEEIGLDIRISTPGGIVWQNTPRVLDSTPAYTVNRKGTLYDFYLEPAPNERNLLREVLLLIGLLTLILTASFFLIRGVLKPLRRLMDGVEAIAEGQLDYAMQSDPGDDFESLANAFNHMTARVKGMIRAREQLLTDLSHELRSPLARMQVSTEFVEKPELKESLKEDLNEMEEMVADVLDAARLSSAHNAIQKQEINLAVLIQNLVRRYGAQSPGVQFSCAEDILIIGDQNQLKSALRNLLENALKYSSQQVDPVQVNLKREGEGVEINVKDHGIGIPQEEQDLIFEAFYRIDKSRTRSTGGFGLGLNLCKKIIEAHGGTITVQSEIGSGSTFTVWLPYG